jgi:hypothetical protein
MLMMGAIFDSPRAIGGAAKGVPVVGGQACLDARRRVEQFSGRNFGKPGAQPAFVTRSSQT